MPDKHGCVGLSDSYKVREVGWCQNLEIFLIIVLLIIYSLLLLFQTFCWLASPTPQPLDSWSRVLTFELWHDDMWYVQLLFILASLEYLFVLPKLHLLQMWTEFLKIYFLLWPLIDFFSIFTFVDQYIYSYMYMYVLEHYINLFISDIIYIGIDATKSQLCIDIYTLMADQLNGLHVRKLQFAFLFNFLPMIY